MGIAWRQVVIDRLDAFPHNFRTLFHSLCPELPDGFLCYVLLHSGFCWFVGAILLQVFDAPFRVERMQTFPDAMSQILVPEKRHRCNIDKELADFQEKVSYVTVLHFFHFMRWLCEK
jgi:hypothetical protein